MPVTSTLTRGGRAGPGQDARVVHLGAVGEDLEDDRAVVGDLVVDPDLGRERRAAAHRVADVRGGVGAQALRVDDPGQGQRQAVAGAPARRCSGPSRPAPSRWRSRCTARSDRIGRRAAGGEGGGVGGGGSGGQDGVCGRAAVGPGREGVGVLPTDCGVGALSPSAEFTMTLRTNGVTVSDEVPIATARPTGTVRKVRSTVRGSRRTLTVDCGRSSPSPSGRARGTTGSRGPGAANDAARDAVERLDRVGVTVGRTVVEDERPRQAAGRDRRPLAVGRVTAERDRLADLPGQRRGRACR